MASIPEIAMRLLDFGSVESDDDDWQPPADWLSVPEPGAWEVYLLIELRKSLMYSVTFSNPDGFIGEGTITVDWGDGTVIAYEGVKRDGSGNIVSGTAWSTLYHNYEKTGQYLIKITTEAKNCFFYSAPIDYYEGMLIAKLGENVRLKCNEGINTSENVFDFARTLNYVLVKNTCGFNEYSFNHCVSLKKLELSAPISEIPRGFLMYNWALSNFDFSEVTKIGNGGLIYTSIKKLSLPKCAEIEQAACDNMYALTEVNAPICTAIGNYAFEYCHNLREIYAPNCTYVGDYAFHECDNLEKVTFAEGCTFGRYVFQNCHNLYPLPEGATN